MTIYTDQQAAQLDRLAHSYRLVRAMYLAVLETAGTHFGELIDVPGIEKDPQPEPDERGVVRIPVDTTHVCIAALEAGLTAQSRANASQRDLLGVNQDSCPKSSSPHG